MNVCQFLPVQSACMEWKHDFVEEEADMKEHPHCCIDDHILKYDSCMGSLLWMSISLRLCMCFRLAWEGAESSWVLNASEGILGTAEQLRVTVTAIAHQWNEWSDTCSIIIIGGDITMWPDCTLHQSIATQESAPHMLSSTTAYHHAYSSPNIKHPMVM